MPDEHAALAKADRDIVEGKRPISGQTIGKPG
jgi:hypothetical protein